VEEAMHHRLHPAIACSRRKADAARGLRSADRLPAVRCANPAGRPSQSSARPSTSSSQASSKALLPGVVPAGDAAVAGDHLALEQGVRADLAQARTHLAGST
jgi:hypothetical protein